MTFCSNIFSITGSATLLLSRPIYFVIYLCIRRRRNAIPAGEPGNPIIILKLDDLYDVGGITERFADARNVILTNNIKAGFGVVTKSIEGLGLNSRFCKLLRTWEATGHIEIWNHGVEHARGEFLSSYGEQLSVLQQSEALLQVP